MKKVLTFQLLLLLFSSFIIGQNSSDCTENFIRTFGTPASDEGRKIVRWNDGYIIAGQSDGSVALVETDLNGIQRSAHVMNILPGLNDIVQSVVLDGNDLIICGNSPGNNAIFENFIFKYDLSTHTVKWSRIYAESTYNQSFLEKVLINPATGTYFVFGQTQPNVAPGSGCDAVWFEIDPQNGAIVKNNNINLGSCETFSDAIISKDNHIYAAGRFNAAGGGTNRMRGSITKMDLSGNEIWSKLYSKNTTTQNARLYFNAVLEHDNFIYAGGHGDMNGTSTSNVVIFLVKTDLNGKMFWQKEYNIMGVNSERIVEMIRGKGFFYLLVNAVRSSGQSGFFILKINDEGNLMWARAYNGVRENEAFDLLYTDEGLLLTGKLNVGSPSGNDILMLKLSSDGTIDDDACNSITTALVNVVTSQNPFEGTYETISFTNNYNLKAEMKSGNNIIFNQNSICASICQDTCSNGFIFHSVSDAALINVSASCSGDQFKLLLEICNRDSVTIPSETPITLYDANPLTSAANPVGNYIFGKRVKSDSCIVIELMAGLEYNHQYYVVVNDYGETPTPFSLGGAFSGGLNDECDYQNNIFSFETGVSDTTYITENIIKGDSVKIGDIYYKTQGDFIQNIKNSEGCDSIIFIRINVSETVVYYDFNKCIAIMGSSNMDYSEFTAIYPNQLLCGTVIAGNIHRINSPENKHSCTPGLNNSLSMCIGSHSGCDYTTLSDKAVVFEITADPQADEYIFVQGLRFYERAPINFEWINGASGVNNYPTKFGIRILLNDIEIFRSAEMLTSREWYEHKFNFRDHEQFVIKAKGTLRFELLPYCPVGNNGAADAWDLEDLKIFATCISRTNRLIAGTITDHKSNPISNATVLFSENPEIAGVKTDMNGRYQIPDNPVNKAVKHTVRKNEACLEGVSTLDMILIQRHILGLEKIVLPAQLIAADIDNNQKITANDLKELRNTILGINSCFRLNDSWRFYPSEYIIKQETPFVFDQFILHHASVKNIMNADFKGIKIGDIDGNTDDGQRLHPRTDNHHFFNAQIQRNAVTTEIIITTEKIDELHGFQFALDLGKNELSEIVPLGIDLNKNDYYLSGGILRFSYIQNKTAAKLQSGNKAIFKIVLKSSENDESTIKLEQTFTSEVYHSNELTVSPLQFRFSEHHITPAESLKLFPNPFSETVLIEFETESDSEAMLEINDVAGKLIFRQSGPFNKGKYTVQLNASQYGLRPGVYYVSLKTAKMITDAKLILLF